MMRNFYDGSGMFGWTMGNWGSLAGLTWILFVVFLILGILYFWKEINRKR